MLDCAELMRVFDLKSSDTEDKLSDLYPTKYTGISSLEPSNAYTNGTSSEAIQYANTID
jgi:hypothetical protein